MTKKEIAAILKKARIDAGLTQIQAADGIGRKQQTLASWETGQSQPDANTLFELCDLYGASVDEIFGYNERRRQKLFTQIAEVVGIQQSDIKPLRELFDLYVNLDKTSREALLITARSMTEAHGKNAPDKVKPGAV